MCAVLHDRQNAGGFVAPIIDTQQDIFDASTEFVDGELILRFSREMVTTDSAMDTSINVPRHWIWAIGPYDLATEQPLQHFERGVSPDFIVLPTAIDCPAGIYCNVI